jgi:hypothetical protein
LCNCLILIVIHKGLKSAFIQHETFNFMTPFDNNDKKTKNLTGKNCLHCPNIQTSSQTQPASHSMGTGGFFPQGQSSWIMEPTTLHLVLCLRMSVATPCSLCVPLWHAWGNFTFWKDGSAIQTNRHLFLDSRIRAKCHNKTRVFSAGDYSWIQQYIVQHGNLLTVTRVKTATRLRMYASLSPVSGYKVLHCFLHLVLYICHYSLDTNYLWTQLSTLSQSHLQYSLFCLMRYVVNFHFFLSNFTVVSCITNNKNTSWHNGRPQ